MNPYHALWPSRAHIESEDRREDIRLGMLVPEFEQPEGTHGSREAAHLQEIELAAHRAARAIFREQILRRP